MKKLDQKKTIETIRALKDKYVADGFFICALFGSVVRDDFNDASDLDILYETDESFLQKYSGFKAFARLQAIADEIKEKTGRDVDFVPRKHLGEIGKKYILSETLDV